MNYINLGIGSRISHTEFGVGVVIQIKLETFVITFINSGLKEIAKSFTGLEIIEEVTPQTDLQTFEEIEKSIIKIMRRFSDVQETVTIADKWKGGKIVFVPGSPELKGYEMPIDNFFHKIVMVRDRLRVMEQRVNSSGIDDQEKVNIQQYITRIYGSLTSFNVLFKNKPDFFIGMKE